MKFTNATFARIAPPAPVAVAVCDPNDVVVAARNRFGREED